MIALTKTFGRQHLTPLAAPLPPTSEAALVGRSLCESLCRAARSRHTLRLHRIGNGLFAARFEYQNGYPETSADRVGPLTRVLAIPVAPFVYDLARSRFGIPTLDEQPVIGELLIRLYGAVEIPDIWMAFEYVPWIEERLRYRLRLRVVRSDKMAAPDFFIHARSAEALLVTGLQFFAASPPPHP